MQVSVRVFFFFFKGGDEKEGRGGAEQRQKSGRGREKWVGGRT